MCVRVLEGRGQQLKLVLQVLGRGRGLSGAGQANKTTAAPGISKTTDNDLKSLDPTTTPLPPPPQPPLVTRHSFNPLAHCSSSCLSFYPLTFRRSFQQQQHSFSSTTTRVSIYRLHLHNNNNNNNNRPLLLPNILHVMADTASITPPPAPAAVWPDFKAGHPAIALFARLPEILVASEGYNEIWGINLEAPKTVPAVVVPEAAATPVEPAVEFRV